MEIRLIFMYKGVKSTKRFNSITWMNFVIVLIALINTKQTQNKRSLVSIVENKMTNANRIIYDT